jgi:hypothetical protein
MYGLVDDYFGERYGKFGRPITFRVYLKTDNKLSDEIFKLADWNFMSAGKECFIGYIIGSIYDNKLWISGIQSDISQRYSWLFQKRGIREIRVGNQVKKMDNSQFIQEYKKEIPIIRNTFQRDWIKILLCSILHFITNNGINTFLLQKFELDELENKKGAFMHRIYRELPQKLNASLTTINVDNIELTYSSIKKNDLAQYLTKFSSEK